ncbi:LamB/YcsF family protein [Rhodospirillaceae bacterium KN72]|uniref:LamB/YcsF family protein n=1 Tax=Pacificispira spongiicola TaxID=2729598 RepID=A0A7Y0E299_9PROT|nr:hypothetical protein [Pacificispira spongiicola]NMM45843.1 LamB/YcsF family protein [Pacificispira spongiicola]
MTGRTIKSTVTFNAPFTLGDLGEVFPPGAYTVETDEELLTGISFHAYRRVLTLIHIPASTGDPNLMRTLTIQNEALDAALARDAATIVSTA